MRTAMATIQSLSVHKVVSSITVLFMVVVTRRTKHKWVSCNLPCIFALFTPEGSLFV